MTTVTPAPATAPNRASRLGRLFQQQAADPAAGDDEADSTHDA